MTRRSCAFLCVLVGIFAGCARRHANEAATAPAVFGGDAPAAEAPAEEANDDPLVDYERRLTEYESALFEVGVPVPAIGRETDGDRSRPNADDELAKSKERQEQGPKPAEAKAAGRASGASDRCDRICELAHATCELADRICDLAQRHRSEARYARTCDRAEHDCALAQEACHDCR